MSSFKEIELDAFDNLKIELEDRLPKSCRVLNILKLTMSKRLPYTLITKFYASGVPFSKKSFIFSFQHFKNLEGGFYIIMCLPDSQYLTSEIMDSFETFLKWDQALHFDFEDNATLNKFFESIAEKRRKGFQVPRWTILEAFAFMLNPDEVNLTGEVETCSEIQLKRLGSEADISTINTNWERESKSLQMISSCLSSLPAIGLFVNDELASWAMTAFHGCLNALFTFPQFQGRGFAKMVTKATVRLQVEMGLIPAARSLRTNVASHRTLKGAGFVKTHDTIWIDYIGGH